PGRADRYCSFVQYAVSGDRKTNKKRRERMKDKCPMTNDDEPPRLSAAEPQPNSSHKGTKLTKGRKICLNSTTFRHSTTEGERDEAAAGWGQPRPTNAEDGPLGEQALPRSGSSAAVRVLARACGLTPAILTSGVLGVEAASQSRA